MARRTITIEDFIHLRIDEKTLLEYADFDKIPKDILKARETKLETVLGDKSNGKNIHK